MGCGDTLGLLRLQFFELQLQLLDLAADLLALGAEDHPPQLGDDQLQVLDLVVAAEELLLLGGERFILGRISFCCAAINASRATRSKVLKSAEAARE